MFKGLLGGRNCTESTQCRSLICKAKEDSDKTVCVGRRDKESCYTSADCDGGYYCSSKPEFPHLALCK